MNLTNLFNRAVAYARPPITLRQLTADLERKVGELDKLTEAQRDAAAGAELAASKSIQKAVSFRAEADRAQRIADRLSDLTA